MILVNVGMGAPGNHNLSIVQCEDSEASCGHTTLTFKAWSGWAAQPTKLFFFFFSSPVYTSVCHTGVSVDNHSLRGMFRN